MTAVISAFAWVPPFAQGLVRDLRVRWALEEVGAPYEVRLLDMGENGSAAYQQWQPFGQVPAYEAGGMALFESGAIVLHIAENHRGLLPKRGTPRARAKTWILAALNTVEPPILFLNQLQQMDTPEARVVASPVRAAIGNRLDQLSSWLGDRDYLEEDFTAGDLLMTTVLRILRDSDLMKERRSIEAYRDRCEARPAFVRALNAQMAAYAAHAPE